MGIEVRIADETDLKKWNDWVQSSPHGTIFHTIEWLKLVQKHQNIELIPIIGTRGSEVTGLFPLFSLKKGLLKAVLSPPPKTGIAYLGPLILNYDQMKQDKREYVLSEFIKSVDEYIFKQLNASYVTVETPLGLDDTRAFQWNKYIVRPVYTYMIDLTRGKENILNGFKKELRKNIKKCEKKGVEVQRTTDLEDVKFIYRSQVARYKEQKRKYTLSWEYLADVFNIFKPSGLINVFIAELQNEKVGGIIVITHKAQKRCSLWVGATGTRNIVGVYPNDLIQWEIISWAAENGFKECEIIGAADPNISFFKARYNPKLAIKFNCSKGTKSGKFAESIYKKLRDMEIL